MAQYAVSVLVPVFNVEKYLRQCLESLSCQTLDDIQIICIDDGSTDKSLEILREFEKKDSRFEVITKPNSGYGNSMNRGLAAAKGEYIGILESDDFGEKDMFEKLYSLAKSNDADVVKSNYYEHMGDRRIEDDNLVLNLLGCRFGVVFEPAEDPAVLMSAPAIWSGLYKKNFLKENNISFLETPGASFQDTSFHFKAFATAKRCVLTEEGYLHYRIDNANSSVKSQAKVFCICDEYEEIRFFLEQRPDIYEKTKYLLPKIQFGGYIWNLNRLVPKLQYDFYCEFIEEFQRYQKQGLLKQELFLEDNWVILSNMLSDPDGYFESHYGPRDVNVTRVVVFAKHAEKRAPFFLKTLLDNSEKNDELFYIFNNEALVENKHIAEILADDPRLYNGKDLFINSVSRALDLEQIRGSHFEVIYLGDEKFEDTGFDWALKKMKEMDVPANVSEELLGTVFGSYSKEYLSAFNYSIMLALLLMNVHGISGNPFGVNAGLISTMFKVEECELQAENYEEALISFNLAVQILQSECERKNPRYCIELTNALNCFWKELRTVFRHMKYDERLGCSVCPTAEAYRAIKCAGSDDDNSHQLSIIVPVYNVAPYLSKAVESILSQSVEDFEVIFVDDGSTDESLDILMKYAEADRRIKVFTQLNGGAGVARNRGILFASGQYLAFIDPDDFYPNEKTLSLLVNKAKENGANICGGSFMAFDPFGKEKAVFRGAESFYTFKKEGWRCFYDDATDYGWIRFIYSKELLLRNNIRFPERTFYEDPVFLGKVMEVEKNYYAVPDITYCYRCDYKKESWPVYKVRDLVKGLFDNLSFAQEEGNVSLYSRIILRIDKDFRLPLIENCNDTEVFLGLIKIQESMHISLINMARESGSHYFLLGPLNDFSKGYHDTRVVRIAKRIEKSSMYKKIQKRYLTIKNSKR